MDGKPQQPCPGNTAKQWTDSPNPSGMKVGVTSLGKLHNSASALAEGKGTMETVVEGSYQHPPLLCDRL